MLTTQKLNLWILWDMLAIQKGQAPLQKSACWCIKALLRSDDSMEILPKSAWIVHVTI